MKTLTEQSLADLLDGAVVDYQLPAPAADALSTPGVDMDAANVLSRVESSDAAATPAVLNEGEDVEAPSAAEPQEPGVPSPGPAGPVYGTEIAVASPVAVAAGESAGDTAAAGMMGSEGVGSAGMQAMMVAPDVRYIGPAVILPGEDGNWTKDYLDYDHGGIIIDDWIRPPSDGTGAGENWDYGTIDEVVVDGDGDVDDGDYGYYDGDGYYGDGGEVIVDGDGNYGDDGEVIVEGDGNYGDDGEYAGYDYSYSYTWTSEAGDVNGDGFDDLIMGSYSVDADGQAGSTSYVVFGNAGGSGGSIDPAALDGSNGFEILLPARYRNGYSSVSTAGDINGDGLADLLVGTYGTDTLGNYDNTSYVVFGRAGGFEAGLDLDALDGTTGFRIAAPEGYEYAYSWVSAAGDLNGDGFGDLLVSSYGSNADGSYAGESYVIFGGDAGFDAVVDSGAPQPETFPGGGDEGEFSGVYRITLTDLPVLYPAFDITIV